MTQSQKYARRWWTLGVLVLSLIVVGLDNMILNVAIPTLQRELNATASQLIWMIDAYIVVFASLLLVAGSLGDRFGRKRTIQIGLVIFGVSSLAAAYSQNPNQLIAARAIMGASAALLVTASLSIVTNTFPREERGRAIGVWAGIMAVGIALGPVAGGLLLEHFWWGSVFLINLPVATLAFAAGVVLLPESQDPSSPPLDIPGFVLSAGAVSSLVYAVIEAPERGWTDWLVLTCFGAALLLVIGFTVRERQTDHPMLDFEFFRNPRFSSGVLAVSLASFALFGVSFSLTQFLQFVQGYTPLQAGVRMIPLSIGIFLGAGSADRFVKRLGTTRVVATGLVLLGAVLATFIVWNPDTAFWLVGSILFVLAFAMGWVMAPSTDAVMGAVPEEKAGVASAMNSVSRMVAGALGAAVIGSVMYTIYASRVAEAVAGLPPDVADAARNSIGAAAQIAASLPPELGAPLAETASIAFTDAIGLAVLIGAGIALVASVLVAKSMPPRHLPVEQTVGPHGPVNGPAVAESFADGTDSDTYDPLQ